MIVLARTSSNLRDSESVLNLRHKPRGHFMVSFLSCGNIARRSIASLV
jgi:hypothetical protein